MKDIAVRLNVSVQTVSMALRGHQRISQATREQVAELAAILGYQADPVMSALSYYRARRMRKVPKWEVIALVDDWEEPGMWHRDVILYQRIRRELQKEASRRGIELVEHWLGCHGAKAPAVFRRLYSAGVRGILAAPKANATKPRPIVFPKNKFQVVTFGPEHIYPDHHVVQFDYYENMRLAWERVRSNGYQRPRLAYFDMIGWRTGDAWLGAYMAEKHLAGFSPDDLQPAILMAGDEASFRQWARRHQPDVIISINCNIITWASMLPRPLPVVRLDLNPPEGCGIDPNPEQAGQSAIELLLIEMQRTLVTDSAPPFRVHIPGRWVDQNQKGPAPSLSGNTRHLHHARDRRTKNDRRDPAVRAHPP